MLRTAALAVLLLSLPSCIAAIGNKASGWSELPPSAALPMLREKVEVMRKIVALRQRQLDDARTRFEAGRAPQTELDTYEIELAEANLRLLEARTELQVVESRARD